MRHCPTLEHLAAYHTGFVAAQERKQLDAHVSSCERCQHELAAMTNLVHLLDRMPVPTMSEDLWPGVAQRLQTRQRWSGFWWRITASAGVAATLMVGLFVYRGYQTALLPAAPSQTAQYVRDHQLLTASDPLTDRASLGVALATYRSTGP